MKGYAAALPVGKRRWRTPLVAVLVLVFFSVIVPLAFLFGFHNRFPSGFLTEDRLPLDTSFGNNGRVASVQESFESAHSRIDKIIKKFEVSPAKTTGKGAFRSADFYVNTKTDAGFTGKGLSGSQNKDNTSQFHQKSALSTIKSQFHLKNTARPSKSKDFHSKAIPKPTIAKAESPPSINTDIFQKNGGKIKRNHSEVLGLNDTRKACQIEYGSYCLWSTEHKETVKDSVVKRLKDQLFVARAFYPSITKLKAQENLSRELKQNIQDHERILSEAISDADLPSFVIKKMQKMDQIIAKAKQCSVDCNHVDKKLRQILDLTEDEAHFHMKQSAFLYKLGVQTMPKSLHCFFMRLTVEYFRSSLEDTDIHDRKFWNPRFRHYVIFSRNVLAASVTVNSTVMNSEETKNMVFHLITDKVNYYAMKYWFTRYSFKESAIHVLNIDQLRKSYPHILAQSELSFSEEFRISIWDMNHSSAEMKTEYISVFGHSHFLLPEIFNNLKKVLVLDDDVVVQHDLSSLWNLDMEGKVIGAVEFCGVTLDQMKVYLASNQYDPGSCIWMSGVNIVDLDKWREHNVTGIYNKILWKTKSMNEASWRAAMLPATILTFQNLVHPLNSSWSLPGLGHDYGVSADVLKEAATLHYNGNMKPWLELGIPMYKRHWRKFLRKGDRFMDDCNVNP